MTACAINYNRATEVACVMMPFPIPPRMDGSVEPNLRLKDLLGSMKELDLSEGWQRDVCRKRASQALHLCGQIHPEAVTKLAMGSATPELLIEYLLTFSSTPYNPVDISLICAAASSLKELLYGGS